ncbi:MAG: hypothetical protein P8013_11290 [Candidatus Sulfobium sp.]
MDLNLFRRLKHRNRNAGRNGEKETPSSGTWSIGIYTGTSPFDLAPAENAANPVLTARDVTDVPAEFVADPFMVHRDGTWYMFFEVLNSQKNLGDIALATSTDGFRWNYGKVVLSERFSLSYPYVFKWEDNYYMVPECNQIKGVRLYRAIDFPEKWVVAGTLLRGQRYSDSSLFRYDGLWWMFTATRSRPRNNGRLRLYYAGRLEGPWTEHPASPVVKNNPKTARPGGRVVVVGGSIVRYAQDDYPVYGRQVRAFRVTELSLASYREEPLGSAPVIAGSGSGWNAGRMHTVDPHRLGPDSWIAAVDGFGEPHMERTTHEP